MAQVARVRYQLRLVQARPPTFPQFQHHLRNAEALSFKLLRGVETFAAYVQRRLPLSEACWAQVPAPCAGLERALPAALAHSEAQAAQLVARLPEEAKQRLRTAALALARQQRRWRVALPGSIVAQLMVLAVA